MRISDWSSDVCSSDVGRRILMAIAQEDTMATQRYRTEHDSMGELQVPAEALWGAQPQRAVQNFPVSGRPMPRGSFRPLALVQASAAPLNADRGLLPTCVPPGSHPAAPPVAP